MILQLHVLAALQVDNKNAAISWNDLHMGTGLFNILSLP